MLHVLVRFCRVYFLAICALFFSLPDAGRCESIIAFGDSITQGLWMIEEPGNGRRVGGYEPFLEQLFSQVGRSASVFNYGYGGETTADALTGEGPSNRTFYGVLERQPADYILIMEGTNDFFMGISAPTTAYNLGVMVDQSRSRYVIPLLATLTPDPRPVGKDIPEINFYIRQVAAQKNVVLVDHYEALVDNWYAYTDPSDRLHPNVDGYRAMARVWFGPFYDLVLETGEAELYGFTALLNGRVSANGNVNGVAFQYGNDPTMEEILQTEPEESLLMPQDTLVTASVVDLEPQVTYYYRIVASLGQVKIYGETKTFTTLNPAQPWIELLLLSKDD